MSKSLFQVIASEFSAAFTRDNPRKVWSLKSDSPDWMTEAIRSAHFDGRLPDDWIYENARSIVDSLSEHESPDDDTQHEICDGLVDVYTSALTTWLASHGLNAGLVDQAQSAGLTSEESTIDQRIQMAQYMALTYICSALRTAIEEQVSERESETRDEYVTGEP